MMGAVVEERPSQGFFGSSSAAGFMRQIRTAVDRRVASPHRGSSVPHLAVPSNLMPTRSEKHQSSVANYVLPPRKMADSLMEVYWECVFPLYPFLVPAEMKTEYAKIWTGDSLEYDENMLMCTLNVIFALASQLADFVPPKEREASADAFFSRAKGLFQFNLWDTGSAGLIQCLLLMAQYLQSTDSAHQCWIVTGLAIRNAQSLGLHLPQNIARLQSFQEQQLARKIWHGCILMDRVISMTFGRPAMISKASSGAVPLPAAVDDEYIPSGSSKEVSQPPDRPSMMAFYAKSLELYEIMNDVLLSLYKPVSDDNAEDIHSFHFDNVASEGERTIFELDRSLTRWTQSLLPHLRWDSSTVSTNPIFYRQSIVLRARFLHVRMLLFRPTLSKYCAVRDNTTTDQLISTNDSFPHRVALQCSIICVKSAQESIGLIYNNVPADGTGGPLPAWWYNILYVYTSATVLIAGRLCSAILAEVTESSITQSWNYALEVLRKYQSYSTSARRCVAALEILYEQVTSEGLLPTNHVPSHEIGTNASVVNDMSFGEGMNAAILDSFEFPDFQDMSWLNSVPSNLF
ncbi:putative transcriptional regulatory protein [Penicillium chrysogenum]|uniref:Putative transcriptional regulatory protein n=2 Tax=Penicillium chrysogenum species complex TaxID=254878 RepID=A0A167V110_PENCH|nr:putative transcriptional regulatory protein [Penicillium chrysogenum]